MANKYRKDRLGEEIKKIISAMLLEGIKDPRLKGRMISVTDVDVTRDGSYATCYISILGGSQLGTNSESPGKEEEEKEVLDGLKSASGLIRSEIAKRIKIRYAPELIFKVDDSLTYGRHIEEVIKTLDIKPERDSLREIADALMAAERIVLFPHVNMDGDALGSSVALLLTLRALGKSCEILISEEIPDNLKFLDPESKYTVTDVEACENADIAAFIDCGELKRISGREKAFTSAQKSICIDHHGTTDSICDLKYIDPDSAATGQIIFFLLKELGVEKGEDIFPIKEIGEAIFAAIITDTGNFQYSNTQKKSHEIAAQLYDWGIDHSKVSVEIYENNRIERIKLSARVMGEVEIFADGKAVIGCVTQDILKETGAKMEETEWIAGDLRAIKGVEVAVLLKEEKESEIKVSLRSKSFYDVAKLAMDFGGGGHIRASGYTYHGNIREAKEEIMSAIEEDFSLL